MPKKRLLSLHVRNELVNAWREWDIRPGNQKTADRFVAARAAAVDELDGLKEPHLGSLLTAWRRAGLSHDLCVLAVEAGIEATAELRAAATARRKR